MSKIFFIAICFLSTFMFTHTTKADSGDYTTFAEIELAEGKLLSKFSNEEIDEYLAYVKKRKFSGWNVYTINNDIKATFISETLFSFYNTGTTPIYYELQTVSDTTTKMSISATGSISYSLKGDIKKFKNGLDASLKIEASYTKTISIKETEKFKLEVDPNTVAVIYLTGSGRVTNGVAARYLFWFETESGGFEYFIVTNLYPRIEKIAL